MAGANVKNYISNQNSSFFSLEDVDDDEFLKNSRRNFSTQSNHVNYNTGIGALQERRLQLMQQKEKIEAESLESTQRSLRLLQESEDIGISTAEELHKQREQLERTDRNLDNINSTLRYTQKKIDGFKSVFGSIKNYLTKKTDNLPSSISRDSKLSSVDKTSYASESQVSQMQTNVHPGLKIRNLEEDPVDSFSINDRIDHNLDQISLSVRNIKGLAINLGEEIESQNELMDRILDKADKADLTLGKQNKEMTKLIKK